MTSDVWRPTPDVNRQTVSARWIPVLHRSRRANLVGMVTLSSLTTRTGDRGQTGLGDGTRRSKSDALIQAIGAVDEVGAILGLVLIEELSPDLAALLRQVQNDLFDLGSDLAVPPGGPHEDKIPRITPTQVERLEAGVAEATARLEPLTSFILAGGTRASAWLHLARTVVRRAERDLVTAMEHEPERAWNPQMLVYLNRLSDGCFAWARLANDGGKADVLWRPGAGR